MFKKDHNIETISRFIIEKFKTIKAEKNNYTGEDKRLKFGEYDNYVLDDVFMRIEPLLLDLSLLDIKRVLHLSINEIASISDIEFVQFKRVLSIYCRSIETNEALQIHAYDIQKGIGIYVDSLEKESLIGKFNGVLALIFEYNDCKSPFKDFKAWCNYTDNDNPTVDEYKKEWKVVASNLDFVNRYIQKVLEMNGAK